MSDTMSLFSSSTTRQEKLRIVKNIVFYVVVFRYGGMFLWALMDKGPKRLWRDLRVYALRLFFSFMKRLPMVQKKIDQEIGQNLAKVRQSIHKQPQKNKKKKEEEEEEEEEEEDNDNEQNNNNNNNVPQFLQLPSTGMSQEEIMNMLVKLREMGHDYKEGKISGCVYHGGDELTDLSCAAYKMFVWSNPLHPDVFPSVRKMEAEVVAMVAKMFNGSDSQVCGTTTSGGTESILLSCLTYKNWAFQTKNITKPEIVAPVSVHCAFDKACSYFGINLIHVPVDPVTCKANVGEMRKAITSNTIAIIGSAPSFPHGVIDDIQPLARLALEKKIGLHVDACLGGFILPFMDKAGYSLSPFDFRVKGVTSISCDTHKYGCAPKGSSVVLYATKALRSHQYFVAPDWPGGIYASPTIAGSRPGALIASCWATMMMIGEEGYIKFAHEIVGATRRIAEGIKHVDGIKLMGHPEAMVVAWTSDVFDIYRMADMLSEKGWNLNSLQYPPSIHLCVTNANKDSVEVFLADVAQVAAELRRTPGKKAEGAGALYGVAQTIPDRSLVDSMARGYIDILYET